MNTTTERGRISEEIARLNVKLAEEEFYLDQLPMRKSLARWNIILYAISILIIWALILGIARGWFGMIVAPICIVFWAIWIGISIKNTKNDIMILLKREYEIEAVNCRLRIKKLKTQIAQLEEEMKKLPIQKYMG